MNTIDEISQLEKTLSDAELNYRLGLDSELSDEEYDKLSKKLTELYSGNIPKTSVLYKVGSDISNDGFTKVNHINPMLSLDNTYNLDELNQWISKIQNTSKFVVEEKIDGCSLSCVYINGKLNRIVTRGDGITGEDVTSNLECIKNIPKTLLIDLPLIEIRGEIYMEYSEFNRINKELEKKGEKLYANPRNLTAGTIKLLDSKESKKRQLHFMVHSIGNIDAPDELKNNLFKNTDTFQQFCISNGFTFVKGKYCNNTEEINEVITQIDKNRKSLSYPIDGAVIKVFEFNIREQLGNTNKVPRWAIAYKFEAEKAKTKIRSITLQVGRTGAIIPVAELDPVELSGSIVKRATCHNIDEMIARDIRIGDNVLIEKSGEIIPYIIEPVKEDRTSDILPYSFDGKCPICGSKAIKIGDLKHWFCSNKKCPGVLQAKMEHFVSRNCMNIENISGAWVESFIKAGYLSTFADFYKLQKSDLMRLERMGDKLAEKILNNISASQYIENWRLLHAIGIPGIGKNMAKEISGYISIEDMLTNNIDNTRQILLNIPNISIKTAEDIINFIIDNKEEIKELLNFVTISYNKTKTGKLTGKKICITGSFNITRDEIISIIEDNGGKFVNSVSSKTDYLIAGESAGSKLVKAQKLGIKIVDSVEDLLNE